MKNINYLLDAIKVFLFVLIALVFFRFIPDFELKYRRVDILSDVVSSKKDSDIMPIEQDTLINDTLPVIDSISLVIDTVVPKTPIKKRQLGYVEIEDFSSEGKSLSRFFKSLDKEKNSKPIRIGVLGDSFIEGDIFTADLRALLQKKYGGSGVGFVPLASIASSFRKSLTHTHSGWKIYSHVYYKKADRSLFPLSGFYFKPEDDAFSSMKFNKSDTVKKVTIFFKNKKQTEMATSLNGGEIVSHKLHASDSVQFIDLYNDKLKSVSLSVNNVDGFTGFGLFAGSDKGVYVDNFSVRGSSGSVLSTINTQLTHQLSERFPYDLLIVQFGLNVVTQDGKRYPNYTRLMASAIKHLKKCYPSVPILVMSVGDKGEKQSDGTYATHVGILPLIEAQRKAAKKTGSLFWNTFDAMGGENSMNGFVSNKPPMASKDYTHITHLGGKKIANEFYKSFIKESERYK